MKRDEVRADNRRNKDNEQAEKRRKRAEQLLRQARRDFERLKAGAKMREDVLDKSELQLWNYYRLIFSGLGHAYERKFAEQYLKQQATKFEPPKYYKTKRQRQTYASDHVVIEVEQWMTWGDWYYSE